MAQPWERQENETSKAYEAFAIYRDLEGKRTFAAVAKTLRKSESLIHRWGTNHDWRERARAYDNSLEEEAHREAVKDRKKMVDRHIQIAMKVQRKALEALDKMEPEKMSARDIKEYIRLATDLERLNREWKEDEASRNLVEVEDFGDTDEDIYGGE